MLTSSVSRTTKRLLSSAKAYSSNSKSKSLWTPDNTVKSPFRDIVVPNISVPEHVWQNLDKWADKTALVCGVTNRSYTYHETFKYSKNFAASLRVKFGIRDGDVVCIMMPNSPEYAVTLLGALEAGAEVTTANPIYTAHEIHRQLLLSNPKLIIGVPETTNVIKAALKLYKQDIPIINVKNTDEGIPEGTVSFNELALDNNVDHSVLNVVNKTPDDICILPYSSGTTGLPKGVELLNRNIVTNLMQLDVEGVKHYDDTTSTSQDSVLAILPFFHIYGIVVVLLHKLAVGQKLVTLPRFQPNTFLNAMKEHRTNLLNAAPPLVVFAASSKDVTKEHLENLKVITSGAAPISIHDIHRLLEKTSDKMNFIQVYGATETSPLSTTDIPGEKNYDSVGYNVSNSELKVVDSDMRTLGPNEVGELLFKGPNVMKGYRNNPEATKNTITEDGWYRTGDLAKIDENGLVTIADRLKELIKVKGFQVPPAELESVLKEHPGILDAAVVGIPDEKLGEAPKAFIVAKDGYKLNTEDISKFVAERVAPYKKVKEIMLLDSIPKNPSGKILRRVLKDKYC